MAASCKAARGSNGPWPHHGVLVAIAIRADHPGTTAAVAPSPPGLPDHPGHGSAAAVVVAITGLAPLAALLNDFQITHSHRNPIVVDDVVEDSPKEEEVRPCGC